MFCYTYIACLVVLCLWFVQSESLHILRFLICGYVLVLFLSLTVNFRFCNIHFLLTTLGLDLFSGAYLNKFTVSMVPSD